jgi:hypothetical protein
VATLRFVCLGLAALSAACAAAPIAKPKPAVLDPDDPGKMFDPPPPEPSASAAAPVFGRLYPEEVRPQLVDRPIAIDALPLAAEDKSTVRISMRPLQGAERTGLNQQAVLHEATLGMLQLGPWQDWNGDLRKDIATSVGCTEGVRSSFVARWLTLENKEGGVFSRFGAGSFEEASCSLKVGSLGTSKATAVVASLGFYAFRDMDGARMIALFPRARTLINENVVVATGTFTLAVFPLTDRRSSALRMTLDDVAVKAFTDALAVVAQPLPKREVAVEVTLVPGADGKPIATLYTESEVP